MVTQLENKYGVLKVKLDTYSIIFVIDCTQCCVLLSELCCLALQKKITQVKLMLMNQNSWGLWLDDACVQKC